MWMKVSQAREHRGVLACGDLNVIWLRDFLPLAWRSALLTRYPAEKP
jgi:hypothetical protein